MMQDPQDTENTELDEQVLTNEFDTDLADEIAAMNAEADAAAAGGDAGGGREFNETPEEKIAKLEEELKTANDRIMRLAADLENTRRRSQQEQQDAIRYGITKFAGDLLSVVDNFQRAVETAPKDEESATLSAVNGMVDGIQMTEKELITVLERHGVKKIDPKGEKFDPNFHQAIAQVPGVNGEAKDHVVDVAQIGFSIGDRVLRAAMVTVSTGKV